MYSVDVMPMKSMDLRQKKTPQLPVMTFINKSERRSNSTCHTYNKKYKSIKKSYKRK